MQKPGILPGTIFTVVVISFAFTFRSKPVFRRWVFAARRGTREIYPKSRRARTR